MILRLQDFMFADRFEDLEESHVEMAVAYINTMFMGVGKLWGPEVCVMSPEERDAKRRLCYNNLVAWRLTQMYPDKTVEGTGGTGSMPLESKSIDGINLKYKDVIRQGGAMALLTTNSYGIDALEMIQTAPENFVLY